MEVHHPRADFRTYPSAEAASWTQRNQESATGSKTIRGSQDMSARHSGEMCDCLGCEVWDGVASPCQKECCSRGQCARSNPDSQRPQEEFPRCCCVRAQVTQGCPAVRAVTEECRSARCPQGLSSQQLPARPAPSAGVRGNENGQLAVTVLTSSDRVPLGCHW